MKGAWGEKAARLYLEKRGWHTAATNFRTRFGEIDIIAENAQYVIFAEVKTRRNARYGPACEAVTPAKQAKIIAVKKSRNDLAIENTRIAGHPFDSVAPKIPVPLAQNRTIIAT